jgi:hypothetical protein
MDGVTQDWLDRELAGSSFADERLGKRLRKLVELMGNAIGSTVPLACQDWANTKAAYRFFSNERVSEAEILAGHFEATRDRFATTEGPILVLQDTSEFTFQREHVAPVGVTYAVNSGKDKAGRYRMHTVCGLLMHASLAVTTDGLPLGLAAIKLESTEIQGHDRFEAEDQPHARADRTKGKLPLAGKHAPVDRAVRRP